MRESWIGLENIALHRTSNDLSQLLLI